MKIVSPTPIVYVLAPVFLFPLRRLIDAVRVRVDLASFSLGRILAEKPRVSSRDSAAAQKNTLGAIGLACRDPAQLNRIGMTT
jgi:hypothetical protein